MTTTTIVALSFFIFLAALLYSAVGQAGASGYLAVMALFGMAPEFMRPTALALNILVATIAAIKFYQVGFFSWDIFWPFALTSIPFSFIGGRLSLPGLAYKLIVALVLLYAAFRLFWMSGEDKDKAVTKGVSLSLALPLGAGIGILSGLVGVGGGIFLSPLLIALGWADMKRAASVSAAFILVNSIAGLSGQIASMASMASLASHTSLANLSGAIPYWAVAAGIGGWIGADYGSRRLGNQILRRLLALILVIAGAKMILA